MIVCRNGSNTRSSDLGKVEESNGRKKQNNEITNYRNAKIQQQEKIKNNCERKIERYFWNGLDQ